MPNINLCIVIVHYNCWKYLQNCIDSIISQTTPPSKLVIVDNASVKSIKKHVSKYKNLSFEIKLIENHENVGFSKACNIGVRESTEEFILFCNPDIVIPKNGIQELYNQYLSNDINLLGCQLSNRVGKLQKVGGVFPKISHMLPILGRVLKKQSIKSFINKNSIIYSDWVTGAVILVSRHDLQKIGLWNEDYFMYMEDVDLGKAAKEKSMKVGFTSKTTWIHHHGKSSTSRKRDRINSKSSLIRSKHTYVSKYFTGISKYIAHFFIFLRYFPELFIAITFAPFFSFDELKIKQQVALNTIKYYYNKS